MASGEDNNEGKDEGLLGGVMEDAIAIGSAILEEGTKNAGKIAEYAVEGSGETFEKTAKTLFGDDGEKIAKTITETVETVVDTGTETVENISEALETGDTSSLTEQFNTGNNAFMGQVSNALGQITKVLSDLTNPPPKESPVNTEFNENNKDTGTKKNGDENKNDDEKDLKNEKDKNKPPPVNEMSFIAKILKKFMPKDMKKSIAGAGSPFIISLGMQGEEYGLENTKIIPDEKDGGLMNGLMMMASYDGQGKFPLPQGIVNIFSSILEIFGIEDPDKNYAQKITMGLAKMILGNDIPKPAEGSLSNSHNNAAKASPSKMLTLEQLEEVAEKIMNPDHLLIGLKLSDSDKIIEPQFLNIARNVITESGQPLPPELEGNKVTFKNYIIGYAKGTAALSDAKDWDKDTDPQTIKAAEEVIKAHNIDDPNGEITKGLAMMAENGSSVISRARQIIQKFSSERDTAPEPDLPPKTPAADLLGL